jgi:hypothetical protein
VREREVQAESGAELALLAPVGPVIERREREKEKERGRDSELERRGERERERERERESSWAAEPSYFRPLTEASAH